MPYFKHHLPFEVKCPSCFIEDMAREAARHDDHRLGSGDHLADKPFAVMPDSANVASTCHQQGASVGARTPRLARR